MVDHPPLEQVRWQLDVIGKGAAQILTSVLDLRDRNSDETLSVWFGRHLEDVTVKVVSANAPAHFSLDYPCWLDVDNGSPLSLLGRPALDQYFCRVVGTTLSELSCNGALKLLLTHASPCTR